MTLVATLPGRPSGWFQVVERHDELDSSNAELLRRHADGHDIVGSALLVDHQSAGRGRSGRTWLDDGGSTLMTSLGLRCPASAAGLVPLAIGLAVATTVQSLLDGADAGTRCEVKWPNDVEIDGRKVAGILVEAAEIDERVLVAVAGMGINLGWSGEPPEEITDRLTTVARAGGGSHRPVAVVSALVAAVADEIEWLVADPMRSLDRYRAACVTIGREIRLDTPTGAIDGTVTRIADDGGLVVRTADGESVHRAGDVHHLRR